MNHPSPLEAVFFAALEKGSPGQRAAYLDEACAHDSDLRRRVEKMLAAQAQPASFLESPAAGLVATIDDPAVTEHPGTVIGPYKLLEQIGEGGFGVVFMAEQQQPIRRKVALKVLKPGMDTRQVVARFEAERQALALMDHPNIARVIDGGMTSLSGGREPPEPAEFSDSIHTQGAYAPRSGRPYFVMELVKGIPITEFCDQAHLPVRDRLELFVDVCQAVQHAHQKGIIHRDLKPTNVMVAMHDDKPVVKVIDFGIAKAVGQQLTDKTLFTNFAQLIGTPLYMSPEQAGQSSLDADTRSDIYSLGVLLYELLTGTTPFDKERLRTVAYDEMRRIILEEEPPRPSTRMTTLGQMASTASVNRKSDPRRLSQLFRGELDWIVMKCLEKDRNRRYETASTLAADVRRYLSDEPVQACPPSAVYRLRKLVRRNRIAVAAALAAFVFVIMAILGLTISNFRIAQEQKLTTVQRNEAEANFRRARQAVDEQFTLVSQSKLFEAPGFQSLRKDLLESALKYYQEFLQQRPDDPELQIEVAAAYLRLYQMYPNMHGCVNADAMQPLEKGLEIVEGLLRDHPADSGLYGKLAGFTKGGRVLHSLLRNPEPHRPELAWVALAERAVAIWEKFVRDNPSEPGFQFDLAGFYLLTHGQQLDLNRSEDALTNVRRAHTIHQKLARDNPKVPEYRAALADSHDELAERLSQAGPPEEVEEHRCRSFELSKELVKECPEVTEYRAMLADSHLVLGDWLSESGKIPEAETHYREALKVNSKLVNDLPNMPFYRSQLAFSYDSLGHLFRDAGRSKDAIQNYRQALEHWEKLAAAWPNLVSYQVSRADCCFNLGPLLAASGQQQEADQVYHKGLESTAPGPDGLNLRAASLILCPDARFRDPSLAVELAKKGLTIEPKDSNMWNTLGIAYYQLGNWKEAIAALEESVNLVHDIGGDQDCLGDDYPFLAMAHWQRGEKELARKYYDQGVRWIKTHSSMTDVPRQARNECRREHHAYQTQAAELLGIKDQPRGKEKEKPHGQGARPLRTVNIWRAAWRRT